MKLRHYFFLILLFFGYTSLAQDIRWGIGFSGGLIIPKNATTGLTSLGTTVQSNIEGQVLGLSFNRFLVYPRYSTLHNLDFDFFSFKPNISITIDNALIRITKLTIAKYTFNFDLTPQKRKWHNYIGFGVTTSIFRIENDDEKSIIINPFQLGYLFSYYSICYVTHTSALFLKIENVDFFGMDNYWSGRLGYSFIINKK
jgi:hypothetical protein